MRLRAGKTNSGEGAGRMVASAVGTARAAGTRGPILVRGDSAYGNRTVVRARLRHGVQFSLVMNRNPAIDRAIAAMRPRGPRCAIPVQSVIPTPAPGSPMPRYTKSPTRLSRPPRPDHRPPGGAPGQGRPLPRCPVHGAAVPAVLHQHRPCGRAGRRHPSPARDHRNRVRRPDRRSACSHPVGPVRRELRLVLCAAIAHNLLRAVRVLAGDRHALARGSTLPRRIVNIPARLARPQHRTILHMPSQSPWSKAWIALWHNTIRHSPPLPTTV
jgi:hypothetical protein